MSDKIHAGAGMAHKDILRSRVGAACFRTALLLLVVAAWAPAVDLWTAAGTEAPQGTRTALPAAETNAVLNAPDLNAGVARVRSRDTRLPTPT